MPIVATVGLDLLDMTVLHLIAALSQHRALVWPEHGQTSPLPVIGGLVAPDRYNLIKALNVPSYAHCERGLGDAA